eukprot:3228780-Amphidinium_carterae.1
MISGTSPVSVLELIHNNVSFHQTYVVQCLLRITAFIVYSVGECFSPWCQATACLWTHCAAANAIRSHILVGLASSNTHTMAEKGWQETMSTCACVVTVLASFARKAQINEHC